MFLCENKGADQFCSYCEADLRLCFCLSILLVFLCSGSIKMYFSSVKNMNASDDLPRYFKACYSHI